MTCLALNNVSIARGRKILSQKLSFTICPGDFLGVLGANGSGKTTLLQTLSGHLAPAAGSITLNGQLLSSFASRHLAQQIGILFQDSAFTFPQTVYEYCLAARFPHQSLLSTHSRHAEQLTQETLTLMQLDALSEQSIQQLSGGEQRRAALAALLIQAPTFFLLDEPANHLDLHHQIRMMSILRELTHQEHAVVMSVHDINLAARYCNKILMLLPDGSSLYGNREEILHTDNLTKLYQHPIDAIRSDGQTYWLPNHQTHQNLPREMQAGHDIKPNQAQEAGGRRAIGVYHGRPASPPN